MRALKSDMLRKVVAKYGQGSDEARLMLHIVVNYDNLTFIRKMYHKIMKDKED